MHFLSKKGMLAGSVRFFIRYLRVTKKSNTRSLIAY
jgi:hypothetical protein